MGSIVSLVVAISVGHRVMCAVCLPIHHCDVLACCDQRSCRGDENSMSGNGNNEHYAETFKAQTSRVDEAGKCV